MKTFSVIMKPCISISEQSKHILVTNFDGAIGSCLYLDQPREYDILYRNQALAQKHAQRLWNQLAAKKHLDWVAHYSFSNSLENFLPKGSKYDLLFYWISFSLWSENLGLSREVMTLASLFHEKSLGFVVASSGLTRRFAENRLTVLQELPVQTLPGFLMHKGLLPHARLQPGLTLYLVVRA